MILILRLELDNETIEISEHTIKDEITQVPYSSLNIDSSDLTTGSGSMLEKKINSSTLTMTKDEIKDFISSYGIDAEKLQTLNKRYILYIIFLLKTGYIVLNDLDVFMKLDTSESRETFILNCIGDSGVTLTSSFEKILVSSSQNRTRSKLFKNYEYSSNNEIIEDIFNPNYKIKNSDMFKFVEGRDSKKYFLSEDNDTNMYSMVVRNADENNTKYLYTLVKDFTPYIDYSVDYYTIPYLILSRQFMPKIYLLKYSIQNAKAHLKNGLSQEFLFYDANKRYSIINKQILDELLFDSIYISRDLYRETFIIPFIKEEYVNYLKEENSLYIKNNNEITIKKGASENSEKYEVSFNTQGKSFYDNFENSLLNINTSTLYGSISKDLKNFFLGKIKQIFKYYTNLGNDIIETGLDYAIKGNYTYKTNIEETKTITREILGPKNIQLVDSNGNKYYNDAVYKEYITTIKTLDVSSKLFENYENDLSDLKTTLSDISNINIYIEEYEDNIAGKNYNDEKDKLQNITKINANKMASTECFYTVDINNKLKKIDYNDIYAEGNENIQIYVLKPEYKKYKVTSLNLSNTNFYKIPTNSIIKSTSQEQTKNITEYMISKEITSSDGIDNLIQIIEKIQKLFNIEGISDQKEIENRKEIIYELFNINSIYSLTIEEGLYLVIILNLLDNYYSYLLDDNTDFNNISFDIDPAVYEFWHTVMLFKQCFVDTTNIMLKFNNFDYSVAYNCTPEKYVSNFIRAVNGMKFIKYKDWK